jgi:hypothetical protein
MSTLLSLILVSLSLGQTLQPVRPFPDVPRNHWAYAAVTELHEKGILKGYPGKYDRSTPHAALFSLIKAINNDDKAMIKELTTSQMLDSWLVRMEVFSSDSRQQTAALKQATAAWKQWARDSKFSDMYEEFTWEEFNAKANRLPLGTETVFRRWVDKFDVFIEFVQGPSGWKVIRISGRH